MEPETSRYDPATASSRGGGLLTFLGPPLGWLIATVGLVVSGTLARPEEGSWLLAAVVGAAGWALMGVAMVAPGGQRKAQPPRPLPAVAAAIWAGAFLLTLGLAAVLGPGFEDRPSSDGFTGWLLAVLFAAGLAGAITVMLERPPEPHPGGRAARAAFAGLIWGVTFAFAAWVTLAAGSLLGQWVSHALEAAAGERAGWVAGWAGAGAIGGLVAGAGAAMIRVWAREE